MSKQQQQSRRPDGKPETAADRKFFDAREVHQGSRPGRVHLKGLAVLLSGGLASEDDGS